MATETKNSSKNPKKANLLDHSSLKHILDESTTEVVKSKGYEEDVRMSNVRLLMGTMIIIIALVAQFYPKKFPENKNFLIGCIILYIVLNGLLQLVMYTKEKNAIMFTYPPSGKMAHSWYKLGSMAVFVSLYATVMKLLKPYSNSLAFIFLMGAGSYNATGLTISSKLPRFSDMYTLTIESADPKSISANKPVELTKSVTKWFTKDGVLVEGLFWRDVEGLINEYNKEPKKGK